MKIYKVKEAIMDCCKEEKKETLCELAKNIEELKKLAKNAKYICHGCYRVTNDPKRIC